MSGNLPETLLIVKLLLFPPGTLYSAQQLRPLWGQISEGICYVHFTRFMIYLLLHPTETFMCVLVTQSCPTLCDPLGCSPPGSSVYGILQARILVAISFSRGSSQCRDQTCISCIAGRFFTTEPRGKTHTGNCMQFSEISQSGCIHLPRTQIKT